MTYIDQEDAELGALLSRARLFLHRNRRLIIGAAFGGALLMGVFGLTADKRYSSSLLLMVEEGGAGPNTSRDIIASELLSYIEGQIHVIGSRDILQQAADRARLAETAEYQPPRPGLLSYPIGVVKRILGGADPDGPMTGDLLEPESHEVRQLRRNLAISQMDKSNVIRISVESTSPQRAAQIAATIADVYIEDRNAYQQRRATELAGWVDERLIELRERLADAEEAVTTYRIENELISGDPDSTLGEQQLIELNTVLIETRAALAEKRATHSRAQQLLEDDDDLQILPEVQNANLITELRSRLLDLELRESELRRLNPGDSRLGVITEERKEVAARLTLEIGRMVAMIRLQLETLEAREALLADALKEAEKRSGEESRSTDRLRALERVVEGYQTLYDRYLGTAGVVDEEVSLLLNSVEIIEHPAVPKQAFFPPTKLFIIWGLLFGGALGVIASILREAASRGFSTSRQVETLLQAPVLAMLPAPANGLGLRMAVAHQPGQPLAEAIRALRLDLTAGNRAAGDRAARLLLVAPVRATDGAGDLAMALALSARQAGKTVLLIDATQGCSALAGAIGLVPADAQTLDLPANHDPGALILRDAALPGIDLLPAGGHGPGPDLCDSPALQQVLADARQSHDLIILMTGPVHESPDITSLARQADQLLLVLREATTSRDMALAAIEKLRPVTAPAVVMVNCNAERVRNHGEGRFMFDAA